VKQHQKYNQINEDKKKGKNNTPIFLREMIYEHHFCTTNNFFAIFKYFFSDFDLRAHNIKGCCISCSILVVQITLLFF